MSEIVFVLPDLGEGLEEAAVNAWLVVEGEEVELNAPLAEIETAKAVVEIPSPFAGRVVRLHAEAGSTIAVGAPLATFEVEGSPEAGAPQPLEAPRAVEPSRALHAPTPGPVAATPAVRKLAKDLGVDLPSVDATGPKGRITRVDVERAAAGRSTEDAELVPLSPLRRTIARNLERVARIPQVTTFREVDCLDLEAFRAELGVSPLPVFVRALADVCVDHSWINASWSEEGVRLHRSVHVGIATDTDRGLVVPVLRDARSRGIGETAAEIARLAGSARAGSLARDELSGATITVTNTGSYGSEWGTPLLDPGHAVTIAIGAIRSRALAVDGLVEVRPACVLSCTFDHRVLDGATVGRALASLVRLLASRERLATLPR